MSTTTQQVGIESLDIVTLVVNDVDEALEFYTGTLGFEVRMDEDFELEGASGRWVTVGLPGQDLLVALVTADEAYYDDETRALMEGTRGTETYWTFRTEDCEATVAALEAGRRDHPGAPGLPVGHRGDVRRPVRQRVQRLRARRRLSVGARRSFGGDHLLGQRARSTRPAGDQRDSKSRRHGVGQFLRPRGYCGSAS